MNTRILVYAALLIGAACLVSPSNAQAACSTPTKSTSGNFIVHTGDCTADNEILFTTTDMTRWGACYLMSTTGAVDVEASLDGTNFNTAAPLSLVDLGATTADPVIVTVALRMYWFGQKFRAIRVRQAGVTAAAATLLCY